MTIAQVKSYFDTKISTLRGAVCKIDKDSLIITHPDILGKFKVYMENDEYATEYLIRGSVQICSVHKDFTKSFDRCLVEALNRFDDYQKYLRLFRFAEWGINDNTSFAKDLLTFLEGRLIIKSSDITTGGSFLFYVNVNDAPDNILPDIRVYSESLYSEIVVSTLTFPQIRKSLGRDSNLTPEKVFSNIIDVVKEMKDNCEQSRQEIENQMDAINQYIQKLNQGSD
jgi:hypothetical protein